MHVKIDLERLCLLNIYYLHFIMPLPKIPPPFHAVITSSSNKLYASINNHFKCFIEFNHTSSIQGLWHEIHISSILYNNGFRVGHKLLVSWLKY